MQIDSEISLDLLHIAPEDFVPWAEAWATYLQEKKNPIDAGSDDARSFAFFVVVTPGLRGQNEQPIAHFDIKVYHAKPG